MSVPTEPVVVGVEAVIESQGLIRRAYKRLRRPSRKFYKARPATASDLLWIRETLKAEFKGEAPSRESILEWQDIHPEHFWVVVRLTERDGGTSEEKIVGTFKVFRCNKHAVELLDIERLSGTSFRPEHFAGPDEVPEAIYIGDVVGRGIWLTVARGWTMHYLTEFLDRQIARGVRYLYSRPLSKEGLFWSRREGFVAVNPRFDGILNHIYKRDNLAISRSLQMTTGKRPAASRLKTLPGAVAS